MSVRVAMAALCLVVVVLAAVLVVAIRQVRYADSTRSQIERSTAHIDCVLRAGPDSARLCPGP